MLKFSKDCQKHNLSILFFLAVLVLPFFSIETVVGEVSPDQEITRQQQQPNTLDKGNEPTDVLDFEKRSHSSLNHRKVRVGLYENKPKIFIDEPGAASGIFVEILNEIARKEKWQLTYVPCEWDECLEALEDGRIDLMPDVAFSPEREKRFDFHDEEVTDSWSAVYANSDRQINKITDLDGKRIAVLKGSIQQRELERLVNGFAFNVAFIEAKSFQEAFMLTANDAADMVVSNHFFGNYFYQQYRLEKTPIVFNPVALYFATPSGTNHDLLKAIDNNLRAMKLEPGSVYYKVLQSWTEKPPEVIVPRYLIWTITSLSGILLLAFVFILLLRWRIRVKAKNLAEANKMLRDSETKFKDLFNKHSAVKLLIDPDNGNIVEANQAAEKFYGWPGEQLRRMRIQDINTLSAEQVKAEMEKAKNFERTHFEFLHRLADGSIKDVAVFSSKIDIQGETFLHSIIHDITKHKNAEKEREKLQAQFVQAQKMESVGRLAGGVAHDFNNTISVITGYAELTMDEVDPSEPIYANLKEILSAGKRSADIIRQLLAFARQQTIAPVVLDLNGAVEGMLKMLRRLIGEDIDLAWNPGRDLWAVKIDPTQVDQLLANLCVNARDAIEDVGKITIETKNIVFGETHCADHAGFVPGEYVMLAISDNGCGMDKETRDQIFEPFFTTKQLGQGTGLGLATVYGIVKQNGGFINVYSEPGQGTTFRLYLSRHAGKTDKIQEKSTAEIPYGNGESVLVVEDDVSILNLTQKILGKLGYAVLTAGTPYDAIHLAEDHAGQIHLLITDVVMPEMNGRDLARRLQSLYPDLKCLFMSGYTANVIAHHGVLEEGANFIQKPFSKKDLADKVRKVLENSG
ncbi:MAG: transporter substrate-binding domain-containing protein [Desulfobacteraceae bacterium]|nr:transporter substrate-binding domain-containing protein [Desulfobacteraceae bacterium]